MPVLVRILSVVVVCLVATAATSARGSRRDWAGSAACGTCHPKELAAWQTTPHAQTRAHLAATGAPEARCLACHGTGEAPAGPAIAVEVGCEACHGAGAAYAPDDVMRDKPLSRALGLADLSTPALRAALSRAVTRARRVRARSMPRRPSTRSQRHMKTVAKFVTSAAKPADFRRRGCPRSRSSAAATSASRA